MSNDQSAFSFELNESLYFEKGQEVEELRGISLDPEISIQSFNDYISIRGAIELNGEYVKLDSSDKAEEKLEEEGNFQARRYVERVDDTDEGLSTFTHRFPVEISIPSYRVKDLSDVTVTVQSFDYEIPEQRQLKLYSTIEIEGIDGQAEATEAETEEVLEEEEPFDRDEEKDTFEFEIKQPEEDLSEQQGQEVLEQSNDFPALEPEVEPAAEKESAEKDRWKYKQTQSLKDFFQEGKSVENEGGMEEESGEVEDTTLSKEGEDAAVVEEHSMHASEEEVEDASYLSDVFRKSEEEEYTRLRLCIVQNNDTIESIAERYEISALQLIKQNGLDDDYDISEGQLLHIPFKRR
ncbi:stage VI sporulation protein D [Virgibacillus xinjiangensis]|uniref:Stage VI sporulation protein D n=1 Tax=Virgibacillus xinjiangensis TaxID=393090 RepID=A0ABV7CUQ6_9BACI